MEYTFYDFLTLIGSLGLFLYGMSLMSEALQKVAGNKLRSILAIMTKNRFCGILTGLFITSIIQSSSATTVMVVSFVNAGLLTLLQSITVIMGANVGTTITAWIISVFGFKISVAKISIPLIALAIPFYFNKKKNNKSWGEFILGFAFFFLGIDLLKNAVPYLQNNPNILQFLTPLTQSGFGSVFIFAFIGIIMTIIMQSSIATVAITLILCSKGWISFELSAAMILGANLGTTISANIAAIPANVSAKRAALAHLTYNILGAIWLLLLFYPFTHLITEIITRFGFGNPTAITSFSQSIDPQTIHAITSNADLTATQEVIKSQLLNYQVASSFGLSLFHTLYNIINAFILIWFVKTIANVVSFVIKKKKSDEEFQLQYVSTGMLSTAELSILQAWKELNVYGVRTNRMFGFIRDLYYEQNETEFVKKFNRIEKYENISDRMEVEIADYLTKVAEGRLSPDSKHKIQMMLRVVSEIESVCDSNYNLAQIIMRKRNDKAVYSKEMDANLDLMLNLVEGGLHHMNEWLENNHSDSNDFNRSVNIEQEINNFHNQLKLQNLRDVEQKKYEYQTSITYMDIIMECEKLGNYIINVVEALNTSTVRK